MRSGRAQQQTGDDEPKFAVRLADSWTSTVFPALTIGMQTPQFIDMLADGIRSAFGLPDPDAVSDDGAGGASGGAPNDGGGGTPGNTRGSAIDTLGDG